MGDIPRYSSKLDALPVFTELYDYRFPDGTQYGAQVHFAKTAISNDSLASQEQRALHANVSAETALPAVTGCDTATSLESCLLSIA